MSKTVLVVGADTSLGALLAARLGGAGGDRVLSWAARADAARESLDRVDRIDDVWIVGPTQGMSARADAAHPAMLDALRHALVGHAVGAVDYVGSAYVVGAKTGSIAEAFLADATTANDADEAAEQAAERAVAALSGEARWPLRVFRTAMLVGTPLEGDVPPAGGVGAFVSALLDFKALIESKAPDYFQRRALRLPATLGAAPNLLPVDAAVDWMIRIARSPRSEASVFHITAKANASLERWSRHLRAAGVRVEWGAPRSSAPPVDLLLRAHTAAFANRTTQPKTFDATLAIAAAGAGFAQPALEEADEAALFLRAASRWSAAREAASHAVAESVASLAQRTLPCDDGGTLEYRIGGAGPAVVCINAMGQGITVWTRLVTRLLEKHTVVYYSPRGTYGELARPFTLKDQELELERILDAEQIRECRIVTWCSGAKVGLELIKRRPAIASAIALVAGAFKPMPGLSKMETAFEGKLFTMCQMVTKQKEMASLVQSFMEAMFMNDAPADANVLSQASRELRSTFIQPFGDVQSTRNYSHQVIDYMSYDIAPTLASIQVPVLLVGGELDEIASPAMSKAVSKRLPNGRYAEIRGGTHYGLFENAEMVANLVERFFASPDAAPMEAVLPSAHGVAAQTTSAGGRGAASAPKDT